MTVIYGISILVFFETQINWNNFEWMDLIEKFDNKIPNQFGPRLVMKKWQIIGH